MGNINLPVQEDVKRQIVEISKVATLSYTEFLECLAKLNLFCQDIAHSQLVFAVKKGTADTLLWRTTVRIAVVLLENVEDDNSGESRLVHRYRLLTLHQFLKVFQAIETQFKAISREASATNFSVILNELDNVSKEQENKNECCICLDRKPELILPCAHSFCLVCIEQWREYQKNCPVCRESVESTNEAWFIYDIPGLNDVTSEIQNILMDLSIPVDNEK